MREYEQKYPEIVRAVYQTENKYSKGVRITDEILLPMVRGKYMAFWPTLTFHLYVKLF